ncbi:copper chaperone PCu(A)C [Microbulbifer yueqingensis]|uniref:copper chaperone PCu(A)C n=1 Tax=Microbulbifer yueqingensis TaxID=658219 RepID=UPI00158775E0|nr:copper chaperone PCu(A)C [Microbulbifer yueqingensis]
MKTALRGLLLAAMSVPALASAGLDVEGYARETLPGASMSAAYLTLRNTGNSARSLQRLELPLHGGARVQIHSTVTEGGISRMRPLAALELPPGGEITMAPGGIHLMLSGAELRAGRKVQLRLYFADGEVLEVGLPVRAITDGVHHDHG